MIYLLDTDTLIYMVRGLKSRRAPAQQRARRILEHCRRTAQTGDSVGLSAITVSELEYGARHSADYDREIQAVRRIVAPFDVCDYDGVRCPECYGRVRQELDARGVAIGAMDLLIAAHALAQGATLVTNNTGHFSRVSGLRVVNWSVA